MFKGFKEKSEGIRASMGTAGDSFWSPTYNLHDDSFQQSMFGPAKFLTHKCEKDKCREEFCSAINFRRHSRVHRKAVYQGTEGTEAQFKEFWDNLSVEEKNKILAETKSFNEEGVHGGDIVAALSKLVQTSSYSFVQKSYFAEAQSLLNVVEGRFRVTAEVLFRLLETTSERTYLSGTSAPIRKQVLDGGKQAKDEKNLIATLTFLLENSLQNAWILHKEKEASRVQQELFNEEQQKEAHKKPQKPEQKLKSSRDDKRVKKNVKRRLRKKRKEKKAQSSEASEGNDGKDEDSPGSSTAALEPEESVASPEESTASPEEPAASPEESAASPEATILTVEELEDQFGPKFQHSQDHRNKTPTNETHRNSTNEWRPSKNRSKRWAPKLSATADITSSYTDARLNPGNFPSLDAARHWTAGSRQTKAKESKPAAESVSSEILGQSAVKKVVEASTVKKFSEPSAVEQVNSEAATKQELLVVTSSEDDTEETSKPLAAEQVPTNKETPSRTIVSEEATSEVTEQPINVTSENSSAAPVALGSGDPSSDPSGSAGTGPSGTDPLDTVWFGSIKAIGIARPGSLKATTSLDVAKGTISATNATFSPTPIDEPDADTVVHDEDTQRPSSSAENEAQISQRARIVQFLGSRYSAAQGDPSATVLELEDEVQDKVQDGDDTAVDGAPRWVDDNGAPPEPPRSGDDSDTSPETRRSGDDSGSSGPGSSGATLPRRPRWGDEELDETEPVKQPGEEPADVEQQQDTKKEQAGGDKRGSKKCRPNSTASTNGREDFLEQNQQQQQPPQQHSRKNRLQQP